MPDHKAQDTCKRFTTCARQVSWAAFFFLGLCIQLQAHAQQGNYPSMTNSCLLLILPLLYGVYSLWGSGAFEIRGLAPLTTDCHTAAISSSSSTITTRSTRFSNRAVRLIIPPPAKGSTRIFGFGEICPIQFRKVGTNHVLPPG